MYSHRLSVCKLASLIAISFDLWSVEQQDEVKAVIDQCLLIKQSALSCEILNWELVKQSLSILNDRGILSWIYGVEEHPKISATECIGRLNGYTLYFSPTSPVISASSINSVRRSPRFLPPTSSGSGSSPRPTLLEPSLHNITASPCESPPRLVLDPFSKELDTFSCSSLESKMDTLYLC